MPPYAIRVSGMQEGWPPPGLLCSGWRRDDDGLAGPLSTVQRDASSEREKRPNERQVRSSQV